MKVRSSETWLIDLYNLLHEMFIELVPRVIDSVQVIVKLVELRIGRLSSCRHEGYVQLFIQHVVPWLHAWRRSQNSTWWSCNQCQYPYLNLIWFILVLTCQHDVYGRSVTNLGPHRRTDSGSQRPVFPDGHRHPFKYYPRSTLLNFSERATEQ